MSLILRQLRLRTTSPPIISIRRYSTEQRQQPLHQPEQPATRPNPHRDFYRGGLGRAVAYNFLIAMATFQVLYWSWLKLESMEVKQEKQDEIRSLEGELKILQGEQKEK